MKNFIITVKQSRKSRKSENKTVLIYSVKRNVINYIGEKDFTVGITVGAESEAYQKLIELKEIPKKAFNFSECDWRGAGYYTYDNPYCRIQTV